MPDKDDIVQMLSYQRNSRFWNRKQNSCYPVPAILLYPSSDTSVLFKSSGSKKFFRNDGDCIAHIEVNVRHLLKHCEGKYESNCLRIPFVDGSIKEFSKKRICRRVF